MSRDPKTNFARAYAGCRCTLDQVHNKVIVSGAQGILSATRTPGGESEGDFTIKLLPNYRIAVGLVTLSWQPDTGQTPFPSREQIDNETFRIKFSDGADAFIDPIDFDFTVQAAAPTTSTP